MLRLALRQTVATLLLMTPALAAVACRAARQDLCANQLRAVPLH